LNVTDLPSSAAEVILRYQREAPVKVGSIAAELGIEVVISDLPLSVSREIPSTSTSGKFG